MLEQQVLEYLKREPHHPQVVFMWVVHLIGFCGGRKTGVLKEE